MKVTQQQVAEALGRGTPLSLSLISSWESTRKPVVPPANRLAQYALFFATRRTIESNPARLLEEHELTEDERTARDVMHADLLSLRSFGDPVLDEPDTWPQRLMSAGAVGDALSGGTWFFPDQRPIIIVSGSMSPRLRSLMPYADLKNPDYVRSYSLADLDALIELHGHIRAVNPAAEVRILRSEEMNEDDFTAHLVLLGGGDFNSVNRDITRRLELAVRQQLRPSEKDTGFFSTADGTTFKPVLDDTNGSLIEDVAHFYRGRNPYNSRRTVTLCNGQYARGTYGAVRALTDVRFRDRNEEFIQQRFRNAQAFSILMRVRIIPNGAVLTPDWTQAEDRLHEWPSDGEA
ncbi:XRE family transcriptional regulator [Paractinoplanes lichenicola]|uniref:XRE family transcriptional regulator n=1 Tax=Paractinoplanes lichenicola TaxID=2802976 RepID=A0ABS1W5T7_9ACTN|nr:XRE family transcriptional regulator [Actinoplanes lichenicola]MBL7262082.1 XRE family transcriptional regulator [Actinoplanes lichenicola]